MLATTQLAKNSEVTSGVTRHNSSTEEQRMQNAYREKNDCGRWIFCLRTALARSL